MNRPLRSPTASVGPSLPIVLRAAVLLLPATAFSVVASGQCPAIDFEDLSPGTVVTNQYVGVTFSVYGGDCSSASCIIDVPDGGCASGTRALRVDDVNEPPCAFHPQMLRMVFDPPVRDVQFAIGPGDDTGAPQDYRIYWYGPGLNDFIDVAYVTTSTGVLGGVHVVSPSTDVRRIDVAAFAGDQPAGIEWIDDLQFDRISTPPEVDITAPTLGSCICSGVMPIWGVAWNGDPAIPSAYYERDWLEVRPANAPPETGWTLIAEFYGAPVGPVPGVLYNFNTSSLDHGWHYARITAENVCGLSASDTVAFFVDKAFGTLSISSPAPEQSVCGELNIIGTVTDGCFDHYTVEYVPADGGSFTPVDPSNPIYTVPKATDCRLAVWDTRLVEDGSYMIRIIAQDQCGNGQDEDLTFTVSVDNSEPCGDCPGDVNDDGAVNVDDLVWVILRWGICP